MQRRRIKHTTTLEERLAANEDAAETWFHENDPEGGSDALPYVLERSLGPRTLQVKRSN